MDKRKTPESLDTDEENKEGVKKLRKQVKQLSKQTEELRQQVEDIEDLTMVEHAGIIELKKIMQGVEGKLSTEGLENKIREVEELAKSAIKDADQSSDIPTQINERIDFLEKRVAELKMSPDIGQTSHLEIGELKQKLRDANGKIENMRMAIDNIREEVKTSLSTAGAGAPGGTGVGPADIETIKSNINSFKDSLKILNDKRGEADVKIGELQKKIEFLENEAKKSVDSNLLEELNKHKREIEMSNAQIESIERVIKKVTADVQNIDKAAEKFKSLDRLIDLQKEVDEKTKSLKVVEDEIRKLSKKVETIYNDLDKRMVEMKIIAGEMAKKFEEVSNISKELKDSKVSADEIKVLRNEINGIKSLVSKMVEFYEGKEGIPKELKVVVDDLQRRMSETESSLVNLNMTINKVNEEVKARAKSPEEAYMKDIVDKLVFLESRIAAIETFYQKTQPVVIE